MFILALNTTLSSRTFTFRDICRKLHFKHSAQSQFSKIVNFWIFEIVVLCILFYLYYWCMGRWFWCLIDPSNIPECPKYPQDLRDPGKYRKMLANTRRQEVFSTNFDMCLRFYTLHLIKSISLYQWLVYNFTAKAMGGIIRLTRQKMSVALWDLLKHDKDLCVIS